MSAAKWRPIETAPKDEAVLIFIPGTEPALEIEIAHCSSDDPDGDWYPATWPLASPIDMPPSHWMPLPSPPALANAGDQS